MQNAEKKRVKESGRWQGEWENSNLENKRNPPPVSSLLNKALGENLRNPWITECENQWEKVLLEEYHGSKPGFFLWRESSDCIKCLIALYVRQRNGMMWRHVTLALAFYDRDRYMKIISFVLEPLCNITQSRGEHIKKKLEEAICTFSNWLVRGITFYHLYTF